MITLIEGVIVFILGTMLGYNFKEQIGLIMDLFKQMFKGKNDPAKPE